MDLDNEVTKLKMLEANYKSNRYRLEDKVAKNYPEEIARTEKLISFFKRLFEFFFGIFKLFLCADKFFFKPI